MAFKPLDDEDDKLVASNDTPLPPDDAMVADTGNNTPQPPLPPGGQQMAGIDPESMRRRQFMALLARSASQAGSIGGRIADAAGPQNFANAMDKADEAAAQNQVRQAQAGAQQSRWDAYNKLSGARVADLQEKNAALDEKVDPVTLAAMKENAKSKPELLRVLNEQGDNLTKRMIDKNPALKTLQGSSSTGVLKPVYKNLIINGEPTQVKVNPDGSQEVVGKAGYAPKVFHGEQGELLTRPGQAPLVPAKVQGQPSVTQSPAPVARQQTAELGAPQQQVAQQDSSGNPYDAGTPKYKAFEAQRAQKNFESDKDVRTGTGKLSQELQKANIPKMEAGMQLVDKLMPGGIYGKGDIPGFGVGSLIPGWAQTEQGQQLRDTVNSMRNEVLHGQFGARITDMEKQMIEQQLNVGMWKTTDQMRNGLRVLNEMIQAQKQNLLAGHTDKEKQNYAGQGGGQSLTSVPSVNPRGGAKNPLSMKQGVSSEVTSDPMEMIQNELKTRQQKGGQ